MAADPWPMIDLSHPEDYNDCDCSSLEQHIPIMQAVGAKQSALRLDERVEQLKQRALVAKNDIDRRDYLEGLSHGYIGAVGIMHGVGFDGAVEIMAEYEAASTPTND